MSTEQSSATARLSVQHVLAALPAVSALTVAALYGLGVLLNVTELLGADVPVLDALPVIPLQDHLTKGLGAVFTSLLLFTTGLVVFLGVLFSYASARSFESFEKQQQALNASLAAAEALRDSLAIEPFERLEVLRAESEAVHQEWRAESGAVHQEWRAALTEWERSTGADEPPGAEFERRSQELGRRIEAEQAAFGRRIEAEQAALMRHVEQRVEQANEHIRQAETAYAAITRGTRLIGLLNRHAQRLFRIVGAAFIAAGAVLPPVLAAGTAAVGLLCVLGSRLFIQQPIVWVTIFALATALPQAVDAYVHPAPLARATIVTDTGVVRGSLITSNGDRYVITAQRNAFMAIPVARVRSVTVVRPRQSKRKNVVQLLFN